MTRQFYIDLCIEHGYDPERSWGDQYPAGDDHFDHPDGLVDNPIVLIEHSRYGQVWVTLHETVQDAADANVNQEYAEDWLDPTIIDTRTAETYHVELRAVPVKEVTHEVRR